MILRPATLPPFNQPLCLTWTGAEGYSDYTYLVLCHATAVRSIGVAQYTSTKKSRMKVVRGKYAE